MEAATRRPVRLRISLILLVATGCFGGGDGSGGEGAGGGAGTASQSAGSDTRICDAHLAWEKKCAAADPSAGGGPFWGETECLQSSWRYLQEAYVRATENCLRTLSCDSIDDTCTEAGLKAIGLDTSGGPPNDPLYEHCIEVAHGCMGVLDDNCLALLVRTEAGRNVTARCLDLACDSIDACLNDPDAFAGN